MALAPKAVMRSLTASLAGLGLVALLSLHCGGRIDGEAPDCPQNINSTCASGSQCTQRLTDCDGPHALSCSCSGGEWKCPELGAPSCANSCAVAKHGTACNTEGLFCAATAQPPCADPKQPDGCTCQGGRFVCSATNCTEPVPQCPMPSMIKEGGKCLGAGTCTGILVCPQGGTAAVSFDCLNGRWTMWEYFQDPCETIEPNDGGTIIVDAGTKG